MARRSDNNVDPDEIKPLRLGIQRTPPAIVIEYESSESGSSKTLQHRIFIDSRVNEHRIKDLIRALKIHPKHGAYVQNVRSHQLTELFQRLDVCSKPELVANRSTVDPGTETGAHAKQQPGASKKEYPIPTKDGARRRSHTTPAKPLKRASVSAHTSDLMVTPSPSPESATTRTLQDQRHSLVNESQQTTTATSSSNSASCGAGSSMNITTATTANLRDSGEGITASATESDLPESEVVDNVRPASLGDGVEVCKTGESWTDFLRRSQERLGAIQEPLDVFEKFRTTDDLGFIFACFAHLFHLATAPISAGGRSKTSVETVAPPWKPDAPGRKWQHPYEPIRLITAGSWKAERVWKLFDERCSRPEYSETSRCGKGSRLEGKHIVVVGAGPCGLRAAIELRLLGASVIVIEKRETFNRINQLHLWPWCGDELKQLGAKCIEPPPTNFGADGDKLHICIRDLQMLLLKVALILGVEVYLGVEYRGCEWIDDSWTVKLRQSHANDNPPSPGAPAEVRNVAVLLGASGLGCKIGKDAELGSIATDHLGAESAIGVVFNFRRLHGPADGKLRSFSMARQFFTDLFKKLEKDTGAELENIVFVKSHLSHYFVMTPSRRCLVKTGVVRDQALELKGENIDKQKLDDFVRKVASFPFKQGEPAVYQALKDDASGEAPTYADNGPMVFDFSKMCRSGEGLAFRHPPDVDPADDLNESSHLLVGVVGDALVEPFWPEGLGISRGFFGVWDSCSAIAEWGAGKSRFHVNAHFQEAYKQLKQLSAATQATLIFDQKKKFTYALAPNTRYRVYDIAQRKSRCNSEAPATPQRKMTLYVDSDCD